MKSLQLWEAQTAVQQRTCCRENGISFFAALRSIAGPSRLLTTNTVSKRSTCRSAVSRSDYALLFLLLILVLAIILRPPAAISNWRIGSLIK